MSSTPKHKILVLDADHKNALAIIRHLGKTGLYEIDTVCHNHSSVAFYSKYVSEKSIIHNPKKNPEAFVDDLMEMLTKKDYLVIIPVSYISYQLCSAQRDRIATKTSITIARFDHITVASSKIKTYNLAEEIGVPYPKIIELSKPEEVEQVETTYPCVIKAPIELGKNMVDYANNKEELVAKYKKMCAAADFGDVLPIIQKYVGGDGAGFFAFYKEGKCQRYFMHKRLREYPPTGGASVVATAYHNEQLLRDGQKILDALDWEGVAMVEFKKDLATDEYNLMEINAKFWGSLDLALSSGVNFAQMLVDDALGKKDFGENKYEMIKFQWLLNGDIFHVIERPWKIFSFIGYLFSAKNDIWLRDLKPNLFQFLYLPVHYYKKIFNK